MQLGPILCLHRSDARTAGAKNNVHLRQQSFLVLRRKGMKGGKSLAEDATYFCLDLRAVYPWSDAADDVEPVRSWIVNERVIRKNRCRLNRQIQIWRRAR